MYYPIFGMVHIKDPLLLTDKSNTFSSDSGFPLSLSEWSFTICPTPHNRKQTVLVANTDLIIIVIIIIIVINY